MKREPWTIHPNRFGAGESAAATPFRVITQPKPARAERIFACVARVPMPARAGGRRDKRGRLDFDGDNWASVTGSALMFARRANPRAPRIGIKYPLRKEYCWWNGSSSLDNILTSDTAVEHVRAWLEHLFPAAAGRVEIFVR